MKTPVNKRCSEELIVWAKNYFTENKEALSLFGINSADDLLRRILEIPRFDEPDKKTEKP